MSFRLFEDLPFNFSHQGSPGTIDSALVESRIKEFAGAVTESSYPAPIYPQFHVLSADKVTRNKTLYTYAAHKGKNEGEEPTGQYSYTKPYFIPIIEQHRASDGCALPASPVFGRMINAKLIKNKESGNAHLAGLAQISDPTAIHEILTGLWLTGSLGSTVPAAHCSICGASLTSEGDLDSHPHRRGGYYRPGKTGEEADSLGFARCAATEKNAQLCYTAVDSYRAIEYSKVVTPSDNASVVVNPNVADVPSSTFGSPSSNASESMTTSLWVPMAESSSRGVSEWGERYIDVISSREVDSSSLGLLSGLKLHEYVDQLEGFSSAAQNLWLPSVSQPAFTESFTEESQAEEEPVESPVEIPEAAIPETPVEPTPKESRYCGPDNTYPAGSLSEVRASLRLLDRKSPAGKSQIKTRLLRVARKSGWSVH